MSETKTVKVVPGFEALLPQLLELHKQSDPDTRDYAEKELRKMAVTSDIVQDFAEDKKDATVAELIKELNQTLEEKGLTSDSS